MSAGAQSPSAAAALFCAAAAVVLGLYATGVVRLLGSERRTARGDAISVTTSGSSFGFHAFPLGPGQVVDVEYRATIRGGRIGVGIGNYSAPLVAAAVGPDFRFHTIESSGQGHFEFSARSWGIYRVQVRPMCGAAAGCSMDYDISWSLAGD